MKPQRPPQLRGPARTPRPPRCRPCRLVAVPRALLSGPTRRPAGQGSPHSVSWQHGLSARGLVTATKPAQPHSRGSSRAAHCTGAHCTDTEPTSHTQAWQLLTHRSPGCNRPGQGRRGLRPRLRSARSALAPSPISEQPCERGACTPRRPAEPPTQAEAPPSPLPLPPLPSLCLSEVGPAGGRTTHEFGEPVWSHAGWKRRRRGVTGALGVTAGGRGHRPQGQVLRGLATPQPLSSPREREPREPRAPG